MIVKSAFRPLPWLANPHSQTLYASLVRPRPRLRVVRERIDLPDGDFIDVDWNDGTGLPAGTPTVVLLHGLTGSIESKYVRGMMNRLRERGWRAVLMHFRGASGEPNRLARGYHSGDTGDFDHFVALLRRRFPDAPLAAIGYSMGGNVLLKWLGERGAGAPLLTAVAVSVPFDLRICAASIREGFSRIYQERLLRAMRRSAKLKFKGMAPPFDLSKLNKLRDFFEYDDAITAPLHGFKDVDDYYDKCSSRGFLKHIAIPTLVVHAKDDPFMSPAVVPTDAELSPQVTIELSDTGGHVGFVSADARGRTTYWLEERIPAWLASYLSVER